MTLPPPECSSCFRGLANENSKLGEGCDYTIFGQLQAVEGLEGWGGSSVNWDLDDGGAQNEILTRLKDDGENQFMSGAAKIERSIIEEAIERFSNDKLDYELRDEDNNQYHGHILFAHGLERVKRRSIQYVLAYRAVLFPQDR